MSKPITVSPAVKFESNTRAVVHASPITPEIFSVTQKLVRIYTLLHSRFVDTDVSLTFRDLLKFIENLLHLEAFFGFQYDHQVDEVLES